MFYVEGVKSKARINMHTADANSAYLKHYQISLLLRATIKNAEDFAQRQIARDQLDIADRKMRFWERHKNFELSQILNNIISLKKADYSQVCINM